jgi:hypothetical protein
MAYRNHGTGGEAFRKGRRTAILSTAQWYASLRMVIVRAPVGQKKFSRAAEGWAAKAPHQGGRVRFEGIEPASDPFRIAPAGMSALAGRC